MNSWHYAAALSNLDKYLTPFHPKARFLGTDIDENWTVDAMVSYAKESFDKGEGWK